MEDNVFFSDAKKSPDILDSLTEMHKSLGEDPQMKIHSFQKLQYGYLIKTKFN